MEQSYTYYLSGYTFETNVFFPELISSTEKINGSIFVHDEVNEKVPADALMKGDYYNEEIKLSCIKNELLGFIAIWNNKNIEVTPPPNKDIAYIRMLILGSISMLLSNCLGNLSLHAASIVINNKAILFCAKTGRGKSSLAAYFYSKGYTVLSDDVTNIYKNETGEIMALPSVPRIKLAKEALQRIGKSHQGLLPIPARIKKYSLPMENIDQTAQFPISHIIFPEFNEHLNHNEMINVKGHAKLMEIKKHIYRPKLGASLPLFKHKNDILFNLISKVEMHHFIRPSDVSKMDQSLEFIENKIIEFKKLSKNEIYVSNWRNHN